MFGEVSCVSLMAGLHHVDLRSLFWRVKLCMRVCKIVCVCVCVQFRTGLMMWVGVKIPGGRLLVSELNWHDMAQAVCQVCVYVHLFWYVCIFACNDKDMCLHMSAFALECLRVYSVISIFTGHVLFTLFFSSLQQTRLPTGFGSTNQLAQRAGQRIVWLTFGGVHTCHSASLCREGCYG